MRKPSKNNIFGTSAKEPLLSRDKFRQSVFDRDNHQCVICGATCSKTVKLDAHHIIERRLFDDGGYYLSNGATLCDQGPGGADGCHMKAEQTLISVEQIRAAAGITNIILPPDAYEDHVYDKWLNSILADGTRTKGPLIEDENVAKILQPVQHLFRTWVKYPRTWHLPWSDGITDDDKVLSSLDQFTDKQVVVTRKMDGENSTFYFDGHMHARSVDGRSHPSRDWAKAWWAERFFDLPKGWRIVGENVYAKHAISYKDLTSYVLGFAIYDHKNICLSWPETLEWFQLLDIEPVPTLYQGSWNETIIKALYDQNRDYEDHEGYVVRLLDAFSYADFSSSVGKYVRANHVVTTKHWTRTEIIPNQLAPNKTPKRD